MNKIKRDQVGIFLAKKGEVGKYIRIAKSEALTISYNPTTETKHYIVDAQPSDTLDTYNITLSQAVETIKGSEDYDYIWSNFAQPRATGEDAKNEVLVVFMAESTEANKFVAWQTNATISINDLNMIDEVINFDIMFGGTIVDGVATITAGQPAFVAN